MSEIPLNIKRKDYCINYLETKLEVKVNGLCLKKKRKVVALSENPLGMRTMPQLFSDLMLIFRKLQREHSPIKSVHILSSRGEKNKTFYSVSQ